MTTIPSWIIEILVGVIALLLSIMVYYRSRMKDVKDDAEEKGGIIAEIKNLKEAVDKSTQGLVDRMITIETRAELRAESCIKHGERITKVEQKAESAHKRLDEHTEVFRDIRRILDELSSK